MDEVVVSYPLPDGWLTPLSGHARLRVLAAGASRSELLDAVGNASGLIALLSDRVDRDLLARAPRLKIVANLAAGYNNIDLDAAARAGIWVTNTPDVLTDATADLTWALLLAAARRIAEADRFLRAERLVQWSPIAFLGMGLRDKVLGIVGWGRIGRAVGERAAGFGMRVQFHDIVAPQGEQSSQAARRVSLETLLATSDIVSLHVPLTPQTRHLLDAQAFGKMRAGALLINTSRGPVVDEQALVDALAKGSIAGAGLDVYEAEPDVSSGLWSMPNVVLLPHIGSATHEARRAMAHLAAQNVVAVLTGKVPPTPVGRGR